MDFTWERVRLFDRDACQVLHDVCTENPRAKVTEVKTKPKSKWRPLPLDTVVSLFSLTQLLFRFYRASAIDNLCINNYCNANIHKQ